MDSLDAILADYLSRVDRGEKPDRAAYLNEHPHLCTELEKFFENLDFLDDRLAEAPKSSPQSSTAWSASVDIAIAADPSQTPTLPAIRGFRVLSELGRGSQGVVYKAEQLGTKRIVALKVIRDGLFASEAERRRLLTEVELASRLSHPSIVSIYHCEPEGGHEHYAMEYVDGEPLDVYLSSRALDVRRTLQLFLPICDAVAYAHQRGVMHRDLKPSNMIVDQSGMVHILDFGLAKAIPGTLATERSTLTHVGEFAGTWYYASPEQAARDPELVDVRTDVYALGVVLYEMLTDCYPYPIVGEPRETVAKHILETAPARPSFVRAEIGGELDTIVLHALRKDPNARYQSAAALADDLRRYLTGEPIIAKRDSRWYLLYATARKYRWYVAGAAAGFAAVVTLAFVYAVLYWRAAAAQATAELRSQMARTVQTDLVAKLDELNALSNRLAVVSSAHPNLVPDDAERPAFPGSLAEWETIASTAPRNLLATMLGKDETAAAQAGAWFGRHEADFAHLRRQIASYRMTPVTEVSSGFELFQGSDSLAAPQRAVEQLAALGRYYHRRGDMAQAVECLEAARLFALDMADGHLLFHKTASIICRDRLYDVVLRILSESLSTDLDDAYLRWVLRDPPIVGYRLAMISEELKLEQLWEAATFVRRGGEGVIDVATLNRLTEGLYAAAGVQDDRTIAATALQELTAEFFGEVAHWDDLPVHILRDRAAQLRQRLIANSAWALLAPMTPEYAEALRVRAAVCGKQQVTILAALVLRYRGQSGQWPAELTAVIPHDSKTGQGTDPFSGLPFGYRIRDGAPVIYSLNIDLTDDGGRPGRWGEPNTDVVLFPP